MPSSTATRARGSEVTAAASRMAGRPAGRWPALTLGQVIDRQHRVRLAAAEGRLQLNDRVAALARQALDHESSSRRMPSVMKVRWKNSSGVLVLGVAVPACTCDMSAANSACWNVPLSTSSCGTAISRQGFSGALRAGQDIRLAVFAGRPALLLEPMQAELRVVIEVVFGQKAIDELQCRFHAHWCAVGFEHCRVLTEDCHPGADDGLDKSTGATGELTPPRVISSSAKGSAAFSSRMNSRRLTVAASDARVAAD
jgi:hypothetical protein